MRPEAQGPYRNTANRRRRLWPLSTYGTGILIAFLGGLLLVLAALAR